MRARRKYLIGLLLMVALQLPSLSAPLAHAEAVFDPATDIFFEYGAESGVIGEPPKPPFEIAGPTPGGDGGSYAVVTNEKARTGTKGVKLYQIPPPKTNPQRRIALMEWSSTKTEMYASWWMYFPDNMADAGGSEQWTNLGGVKTRYGPSEQRWKYWSGVSFCVDDGSPRRIYVRWSRLYSTTGGTANYYWSNFYLNSTYVNKWLHFQIYAKLGKSFDGIYQAWIGDGTTTQPVMNEAGLTNDPRGDPRWETKGLVMQYANVQYFNVLLYQEQNSPERWVYTDDIVLSDAKVPETYGTGYQSLEFESWEDGFERDDFSRWNGIEFANGGYEPTVTSTYAYGGSYSANFTADGTINSYSRLIRTVSDVSEVYIRSFVRFEDLPNTNNSVLWFHRIAQSDGTYIAAAGVHRVNADYYWIIYHSDSVMNETRSTINPDTWYGAEFHFNATTKGKATLWVYDNEETKMCEMSGDYSSYGPIGIVYPYIYAGGWNGSQPAPKTLFHDDFAVGNERIEWGTPIVSKASVGFSAIGEQTPLENVKINGTYSTDSSGYYEWADLTCNQVYTFGIEIPTGYYPAWVLNVKGSYDWNGTHYIISHNVTETQTASIEVYFSSTEQAYIKSSTEKLTSAFSSSSSQNPHTFMSFNITADIGATSRIEIYTADEGHPRPFKIEGAADWSYDSVNEILTVWILHTSEEVVDIEWRGAAMGQ